jgi:hypothetical protein
MDRHVDRQGVDVQGCTGCFIILLMWLVFFMLGWIAHGALS